MELYFNPYPDAAESEEAFLGHAIRTIDALKLLDKTMKLTAVSAKNKALTDIVLYRESGAPCWFQKVLNKTRGANHEQLRFLLLKLTSGQILESLPDEDELDWLLTDIGIRAPILVYAAKRDAISLTIPTTPGWNMDVLRFEGRSEVLPNLWGQQDISSLKAHCICSLPSAKERFAIEFKAAYCDGALANAPDERLWEEYGFFETMRRAQSRGYAAVKPHIEDVRGTKKGRLLELRCLGTGWRIFFVCSGQAILIAGFYPKKNIREQSREIQEACNRINKQI